MQIWQPTNRLWAAPFPFVATVLGFEPNLRYEFNDLGALIPGQGRIMPAGLSLGAYHGSEVQYLFKMTQLPGPQATAQQQLSSEMTRYWANFAKTGNPNAPGLVDWPRYEANTHQLLSLRPGGSAVIDNFDSDHHCAFWAAAPDPVQSVSFTAQNEMNMIHNE